MKKEKFFKPLAVVFILLVACSAWAYDFEVDGIYYKTIKSSVAVTHSETAAGSYSGAVIIPEKVEYNGEEYAVVSIDESAFYSCSELQSVTIPNSVKSIGESAFAWCTDLTTITIPSSVTTIGTSAFQNCTALFTVMLYEGLLSIGDEAFAGCSDLSDITIPQSITFIGHDAFAGCSSLPRPLGPPVPPVVLEQPLEPAPVDEPNPLVEPGPVEE